MNTFHADGYNDFFKTINKKIIKDQSLLLKLFKVYENWIIALRNIY